MASSISTSSYVPGFVKPYSHRPKTLDRSDMQRSFESGRDKYTTFVLNLGDFTWYVHPQLMGNESRYYYEAIYVKNSGTDYIRGDLWMFARVLQFVYYGDFQEDPRSRGNNRGGRGLSVIEIMKLGCNNPTVRAELSEPRFASRHKGMELYQKMLDMANDYEMPFLQKCAQTKIDKLTLPDNEERYAVWFSEEKLRQMDGDPAIKQDIAETIAQNFDGLVKSPQWTDRVGMWMRQDFELCTLVMYYLREQSREAQDEVEDLREFYTAYDDERTKRERSSPVAQRPKTIRFNSNKSVTDLTLGQTGTNRSATSLGSSRSNTDLSTETALPHRRR